MRRILFAQAIRRGNAMLEKEIDARLLVREHEERGIAVLVLRDSYMNYASADVLKPRLKKLVGEMMLDRGYRKFVLSLASVGVIDSSGLAVLISLKKYIHGRGGTFALSNMSAMIQRLFRLTKLDRSFDVFPSEQEAVAAI
jgi:anti-sigma B factor antagonist